MPKVTVEISGPAGSGKTTLGIEIVKALRALGVPVAWTEDDLPSSVMESLTKHVDPDRVAALVNHGLVVNVKTRQASRKPK
jgi:Ni2+-binding GTPase involved in maturation of urease and hydrogenase